MAEEITTNEVPLVQNEMTKKLGYVLLVNGMILADIGFIATVFFKIVLPEIAVQLILGKILIAAVLLGYIKYIKRV
jgi:hypothetical protein